MKFQYLLLFLLLPILSFAQDSEQQTVNDSIVIKRLTQEQWIDSVFSHMTVDERIGQLFMIRAHSNKNRAYHLKVKSYIEKYRVGGLCFFQGGPVRQIKLVNEYQKASKTPLLISIDAEWGLGMRLDSCVRFPRQMTLGAIRDDSLIYEIGKAIGSQVALVGAHMDFAPVVDVNSNPMNPIINSRSWGENPDEVARQASLMAKGMEAAGILACAKHFPGHGDTQSDSHKTLPTVESDSSELFNIHLKPFKVLVDQKIAAVMVAHLFVPALDSTSGRASSLSPAIVQGLLKDSLGFQGLAITDALEMKGVSQYFAPGEIELLAYKAGNDILLMPPDMDKAIERFKQAFGNNEIDTSDFNSRIKKILSVKYQQQLDEIQHIPSHDVLDKINNLHTLGLIQTAYEKALTLVVNKDSILPLKQNNKEKIAVLSIGNNANNAFSNTLADFHKIAKYSLSSKANMSQVKQMAQKLQGFDKIIISIMATNNSAYKNYGISQASVDLVNLLCQNQEVILLINGNPYSAARFIKQCEPKAVIIGYQDNAYVHKAAAQAIFGALEFDGKLPVTIDENHKAGEGISTKRVLLGESTPEGVGFNGEKLLRIDSIVENGIEVGAYPGARVLIAKNGKIFYDKSFGYYNYQKKKKVSPETIYDLASVTKVMATTMAIMRLRDEGKIDIDAYVSSYLPLLKNTALEKVIIRDLLAHQARLQPWIPFYLNLNNKGQLDPNVLSRVETEKFSVQVADHLYTIPSFRDTILKKISESKLLRRKKYRYSDLGMYLMREIIEKQSGTSLDHYCDSVFYRPLFLETMGFNPIQRFPKNRIAPTENDVYFRNQLVQGFVHDQGAALLGGVSGHAGLFSNAHDMAVLCQMMLQNGSYANRSYFSAKQMEEFNRQQFPLNNNRRGLGFDKPLPLHEDGGPTCNEVSPASFGHSGFTGTYFWVDPEYDLIYIFLSNRVNPDAENRKLISMNIRTNIQEEIYHQMGIDKP